MGCSMGKPRGICPGLPRGVSQGPIPWKIRWNLLARCTYHEIPHGIFHMPIGYALACAIIFHLVPVGVMPRESNRHGLSRGTHHETTHEGFR